MQTTTQTPEVYSHAWFRFKVGDRIFYNEEVLTVSQLTEINNWPAYFVKEYGDKIADCECSVPPVPVS